MESLLIIEKSVAVLLLKSTVKQHEAGKKKPTQVKAMTDKEKDWC